ncbi:MAG: hypothetical protein V9F06_04450 [Thermomicrobiales bacterium]
MLMFHDGNTTRQPLFCTREELEAQGGRLEGNVFVMPAGERYLPLYEAKMIHQFDHRWATYKGLDSGDVPQDDKRRPECAALPRYWVLQSDVVNRVPGDWRTWVASGYGGISVEYNERANRYRDYCPYGWSWAHDAVDHVE